MQYVGFILDDHNDYKEFLPYSEQLKTKQQQRTIFFHMFNTYMDKSLQFSEREIDSSVSIANTFRQKIIALTDISCIRPYTIYSGGKLQIDISTSLLIYAYFTHKSISFPLRKKPFMIVGKLIELIYAKEGLSLLMDVEDMFLHLVYERLKKVNKYADILLYEKHIVIKDKRAHVADSLIIPQYKKLDNENLYNDVDFVAQMNIVQKRLNDGEIQQIYLVYPKHPRFRKHIKIKLPYQTKYDADKYMIKVTPYSFSFCDKSSRKKHIHNLSTSINPKLQS